MNIRSMTSKGRTISACFSSLALLLMAPLAAAAEIQSLSWAAGASTPTLQVTIDGDASYKAEVLEGGQWLRLAFPDTKLGQQALDLDGQQYVRGVYPSMAADGTTANIDLVLDQPGKVQVEKTQTGYAAAISLEQATTVAPAQPEVAAAPAPTAPPLNEIKEVVYAKLPGERIQITVRMAQTPSDPSTFSITNPARISFDFPNTRVTMVNKTVPVRAGAVTSVTAVEADGRTRLVLNLLKPVGYTAAVDGNNYVLTVNAPPTTIASAEQPKMTHFGSARESGKYSLKSIDFRRGPQADGKIVIKLSDPAVGVDIREQAGEIILDFSNTSVSPELQRRLDVVDFATPVQTVDTFAQGRNTRMVITPKGRYEHVAYQTGDVFTVSIKPVIEKPDEKKVDEFGYSGEKLSLNFQNIDVRAALQVLADFTGLNFVVSDTVKGALTLRLKDVPWDQALDLIVDAKNLAVRKKGNVVTVAPASEVAAKEKASLEATKTIIEIEPLVSELVQINYAKASDIAALLKSVKASNQATTQGGSVIQASPTSADNSLTSNSLLSPRGQVTVDDRTNSVLVQDTPGKIREVRSLIAKLDQPVRQVLIEARLVEATNNFAQGIGIRWGHLSDGAIGNNRVVTGGSLDSPGTLSTATSPNGFNVNLASGGAGTATTPGLFAVTLQAGARMLDLELSALEQEGQGKIISSPRVITANQKKAKIEQGQEATFVSFEGSEVVRTTKRATLKLEVTPQITPDDRVNLDVNITKDNFVDASIGLLNLKDINTTVLLDNGETVVIGGIYEQDKNNTETKIPFFGDIPVLGWLFKNKSLKDNKTELLIFLTPRIVSQNLTLR
ncbi:MAG: type IV pilus secretin PilQ [Gammaproteobacteria bacterium]|nr:type IV pilus secretin PilQ [Gammaproteobacteria bacterium]